MNETRSVDTGTRVPRQIAAQADHARELLRQQAEPPAAEPPDPAAAPAAPVTFTQEDLLSAPTPEKDASPAYWKGRCNLIEGFRLEEIRTRKRMVDGLKTKITELEGEVASLKSKNTELVSSHPTVAPKIDLSKHFKPEVLERIGEENAEAILQANLGVVESMLADRIKIAIQPLLDRMPPAKAPATTAPDQEAQIEFVRALGDPLNGVPKWREINKDPRFLEWLGGEDQFSGKTRQEVLSEHEKKLDAAAIVAMLKRFLELPPPAAVPAQPPATPPSLSGNGNEGPRPADEGASDGVFLTEAQIRQGYTRKALGKMNAEEVARFEARVAAQMKAQGRA